MEWDLLSGLVPGVCKLGDVKGASVAGAGGTPAAEFLPLRSTQSCPVAEYYEVRQ